MRTRWEAGTEPDLDEPATITERQLRSLRRGARAGRLAVLLAVVSALAAGWSLLMGGDALAGIQGVEDVKQRVLAVIGRPAPEEPLPVAAPDSLRAPMTSGPPESVRVADDAAPAPGGHAETRTSPNEAPGAR
jgi:hypothetical protein